MSGQKQACLLLARKLDSLYSRSLFALHCMWASSGLLSWTWVLSLGNQDNYPDTLTSFVSGVSCLLSASMELWMFNLLAWVVILVGVLLLQFSYVRSNLFTLGQFLINYRDSWQVMTPLASCLWDILTSFLVFFFFSSNS